MALLLIASSSWASPAAPTARDVRADRLAPARHAPPKFVVGRALVKLKDVDTPALLSDKPADQRRLRAVLAAIHDDTGVTLTLERAMVWNWGVYRVEGASDEATTERAVQALLKSKHVDKSSVDRVMQPFRRPNDEFYTLMWHLDSIGAEAAWDITIGTSGRRIGVIDTGTVRNHEDLADKDVTGFDMISGGSLVGGPPAEQDGTGGRDSNYEDPGDAGDCGFGFQPDSFHGSHVAGTILAETNNGTGIAGVSWNAGLVTARALGRCGGFNSDILESIAYLVGSEVPGVPTLPVADRPRIVNMSLGATGAPCDSVSQDFFTQGTELGLLLVVASGNDGAPVASPANCDDAIAVAAFGPGGSRPLAGYSNFGPEITIVAPGGRQGETGVFEDGVLSLYGEDPFYTFYDGTSMAAPHVAGAVSLLLELDDNLTRNEVANLLVNNSASCSGCGSKRALQIDVALQALADQVGVVVTEPGDACIDGACSGGQACVNGTCRQSCGDSTDCSASEVCLADVCAPGCDDDDDCDAGFVCDLATAGCRPEDAEPEPLPEGSCDPRRGNMDCENGARCEDGNDDGIGTCDSGDAGDVKTGGLCEDDDDCDSGLCDRGVCTVTCDLDDGDCRDGYDCDDEEVPGGLCRAESCLDDPSICEDGWECSYSADQRYVCAVGPSNYGGCLSAQVTTTGAPASSLLLVSLVLVLRRRRR